MEAGRFYDVSWLVSGMVVREWDCFCPCSPPRNKAAAASGSGGGGSSGRPHHVDDAIAMAPTVESFESLMPGLHPDNMWLLGSGKSYALRSSLFEPLHEACPVPTLWVDHQHHNADVLEWLKSPRCSISRLIIANTSSKIVSSIFDALEKSWPKSSIHHLAFYNCCLSEDDHWDRLVDMLTSSKCPIRSLFCAHLQPPAVVHLQSLIQIAQDPNSKISELLIHGASNGLLPRRKFKNLLKVLHNEGSALRRLSVTACNLQDEDVEEVSSFLRSPCCKLTALNLSANSFSDIALQRLREALMEGQRLSSEGLKSFSLNMLSLCGSPLYLRDKRVTNAVTEVMEDPACCLEILDLTGRSTDSEWIRDLSQILRRPGCKVRSLYLFHASYMASDHAPANEKLIDALKVNKHITNLQFPWASEAYKQIADTLLQRNILLKSTGLVNEPLVPSQCTKIFLCGHEGAGKTTLRKNLLYSSNIKSMFGNLHGRVAKRQITHGMKLSILHTKDSDGSAVICDLAGQREYHALHHFFMTSSNEDLFVVVCKYEKAKPHEQDLTMFESRLEYWLRFIVSHRTHSHPKPMVMLVVNFFKSSKKKSQSRLETARIVTQEAVKKYEDLLDFGQNACNVFGVKLTSLKPSHTEPIKERIEVLISELIRKRNPIFRICGDIASAIRIGKVDAPKKAGGTVITTVGKLLRDYKDMCQENHEYTLPTSDAGFEAALLELHKIGQVVFFKSRAASRMHEQMVILDPVWFYETLVGSFVEPMMRPFSQPGSSSSRQQPASGVWKESEIKLQILEKGQCEALYIDRILSYLQMLDLFYVVEDRPGNRLLLFPTILPDNEGNRAVDWLSGSSSSSRRFRFFGRRLECEDTERSLLPWGVFTRLQVQLHAVYGTNSKYSVGYGWITFTHDEVKTFIRFGGANSNFWEDRHWIDIMVSFTAESSSNRALEIKAEAIVSKSRNIILQICQGLDRGCAGITLEEWVLFDKSASEAVLLSKAKEQVHLHGIQGDCAQDWFREEARASRRAMSNLFFPSEVNEFLMQNAAAVKDLKEEFALHDDAALIAQLSPEKMRLYNLFTRGGDEFAGKNLNIHTMVELLEHMKENIEACVTEKLMRREEAVAGSMLPLCPYLADEQGRWAPKLIAMVQVKQARLHLMCESYKGCHWVKEQAGVRITISSPEWVARAVPVLVPGLKLAYELAKIGASIFLPGAQAFMPETETLFSALGVPDRMSIQRHSETFPLLLSSFVEGLPHVQQNLDALASSGLPSCSLLEDFYRFTLEGRLDQVVMERDFALHRVYFPSKGRTSWVCTDHLHRGFQEDRAELLPPSNPFQSLARQSSS